MNEVHLIRERTSLQGTEGTLIVNGHQFFTIELPWKNNQSNISCIPDGNYPCAIKHSKKFGIVYQLEDVPDRVGVLIHSGNFAGSTDDGYLTHSHGCIIIGNARGSIKGQQAVLYSKPALHDFMDITNGEPFLLVVTGLEE